MNNTHEVYDIQDVDYIILNINKIPAEILKLFNNSAESANGNNKLSLLDCIQEYSFKSMYSEEQICDVLSDDELFKYILLDDCNVNNYGIILDDEMVNIESCKDITDPNLWEV